MLNAVGSNKAQVNFETIQKADYEAMDKLVMAELHQYLRKCFDEMNLDSPEGFFIFTDGLDKFIEKHFEVKGR